MVDKVKFNTKTEYREYSKHIRKQLNIKTISTKIVNNIQKEISYTKAATILGFYPFNNEIDITKLYLDKSKQWVLPRVSNNFKDLNIYKYCINDQLEKNKWGISEPSLTAKQINPKSIDLAVIPALSVDKTFLGLTSPINISS